MRGLFVSCSLNISLSTIAVNSNLKHFRIESKIAQNPAILVNFTCLNFDEYPVLSVRARIVGDRPVTYLQQAAVVLMLPFATGTTVVLGKVVQKACETVFGHPTQVTHVLVGILGAIKPLFWICERLVCPVWSVLARISFSKESVSYWASVLVS